MKSQQSLEAVCAILNSEPPAETQEVRDRRHTGDLDRLAGWLSPLMICFNTSSFCLDLLFQGMNRESELLGLLVRFSCPSNVISGMSFDSWECSGLRVALAMRVAIQINFLSGTGLISAALLRSVWL